MVHKDLTFLPGTCTVSRSKRFSVLSEGSDPVYCGSEIALSGVLSRSLDRVAH